MLPCDTAWLSSANSDSILTPMASCYSLDEEREPPCSAELIKSTRLIYLEDGVTLSKLGSEIRCEKPPLAAVEKDNSV